MTKYPEHEKLKAVKEKSQECGEFLEWLRNKGPREAMRAPIESLLGEFYEIDLDLIEKEKRQMLDEIRESNKRK